MATMQVHLEREHENDRITGDQYSEIYTALTSSVLTQSVQFLLGIGKLQLEKSLTALQLAKLQKEIALLCQKLVTEKAQVMDTTILDPTATEATSGVGAEGSLATTINTVEGLVGRKNAILVRQEKGYDDDYKTKVGRIILDAHKVLLSNIVDLGTLPSQFTNSEINEVVKNLKVDSDIGD